MRCYYAGKACDCGNKDMEDECPHDTFDQENQEYAEAWDDFSEDMEAKCRATHSED